MLSRLRPFAPLAAVISFGVYMAGAAALRMGAISADSWYDLVSGREVWQHGIPHHDHLAVLSHGRLWVDQQWLAQAVYYALARAGGLHLVFAVHLLLYTGGVAFACWAGYLTSRNLLRVAVCALVPVLVLNGWWAIPRAQDFSVLLFGVFLYLIARDRLHHDRRLLVALPLLALWANLHGGCLLGAALLVVYGVKLLLEWRELGRLLVLSPLLLFVSPYGPGELAGYYRAMLTNPALQAYVSEWQPPRLASDPFVFLTAAAVVALLWLSRRKLGWFEGLAMSAAITAALSAQRNLVWYALAVSAYAPSLLPALSPVGARLCSLGRKAANVALLLPLLAVAVAAAAVWKPARPEPPMLAARIVHGPVWASAGYADWLLWQRPDLRGQIAFDIRWELLPPKTITVLARTIRSGGNYRTALAGYRYVLVDSSYEVELDHKLARDRAFRLVGQVGVARLYRHR